jgi:hypothetical protein
MSAATELSTPFDVSLFDVSAVDVPLVDVPLVDVPLVDVPLVDVAPWDLAPRGRRDNGRLASVTVLHPPAERSTAAPLRLTRRGIVVLGLAVALLAGLLLGLAHASAPPAAARHAVPATITVRSGDSLWSIATRAAPDRDPRAEVAELQQLNHLSGAVLVPGQVLRTR